MMSRDAHTLLRECIAVREDYRLDVEGRHSTWACRTFSSFWKAAPLCDVSAVAGVCDFASCPRRLLSYVVAVGVSFIVCLYYCLSRLVCDVYFYCGIDYSWSYDYMLSPNLVWKELKSVMRV
jgi:hypothetical protein